MTTSKTTRHTSRFSSRTVGTLPDRTPTRHGMSLPRLAGRFRAFPRQSSRRWCSRADRRARSGHATFYCAPSLQTGVVTQPLRFAFRTIAQDSITLRHTFTFGARLRHSIGSPRALSLGHIQSGESMSIQTRMANKSVETNRRPASPFHAEREFGSASCAPPSLSAAVAHLWRSAHEA